jgi:hypothetical protein
MNDKSAEHLYEIVMNDIPKNPVNISGNILVCNQGCKLRYTLKQIDSFTVVKNRSHLLLKNLMVDGKPIENRRQNYLVTYNGATENSSYSATHYYLNSIAINIPGTVYHGGRLSPGNYSLIFKGVGNDILVLVIPFKREGDHHDSEMNEVDIGFFSAIESALPLELATNHTDDVKVKSWSPEMLLPRKNSQSGKDHSFYSFVSPYNPHICYIVYKDSAIFSRNLYNEIVGKIKLKFKMH